MATDVTDLLKRTRAGDSAAREALFAWLRDEMKRGAEPRVHKQRPQGVDSSDLAQMTLKKALEGFDRFLGSTEAEMRGWGLAILENVVRDVLRRSSRKKRDERHHVSLDQMGGDLPLRADDRDEPERSQARRQVARKQERQLLLCAILQLDKGQRDVMWHHIQGRKISEISQQMGLTDKAVANRISRAVAKLRQTATLEADAEGLQAAFLDYLYCLERGEVLDGEAFLRLRARDVDQPALRRLIDSLGWIKAELTSEAESAS